MGVLPLFLFFIEGVVLPHFFFLMGFLPLFLFFSEGVVLPHFFSPGLFALFFLVFVFSCLFLFSGVRFLSHFFWEYPQFNVDRGAHS